MTTSYDKSEKKYPDDKQDKGSFKILLARATTTTACAAIACVK